MPLSVLDRPLPALTFAARISCVAAGALVLAAGALAVFRTDNELGSTALVAAGVVIGALGIFGNHIEAVEAAGIRFELERQARSAHEQAQRARAAGETDRAEQLEQHARNLFAAVSDVGARYDELRSSEPSSWQRTSRLEGILREARKLDTRVLTSEDVARIFYSGTNGSRITALALMEAEPRLATVDVVVDALLHSRSPFEQYHALRGTESSFEQFSAEDRRRVCRALETLLAGPLGQKSSDRRTVARRILETAAAARDADAAPGQSRW